MSFKGTRPSQQARNREIMRMHFAGASRFEIALRFGFSHDHAHKICRILKGGGNGKAPPEKTDRNKQIKKLRKRGRSVHDIAVLFRISNTTVRDILRREVPYDGPTWAEIQTRRLH